MSGHYTCVESGRPGLLPQGGQSDPGNPKDPQGGLETAHSTRYTYFWLLNTPRGLQHGSFIEIATILENYTQLTITNAVNEAAVVSYLRRLRLRDLYGEMSNTLDVIMASVVASPDTIAVMNDTLTKLWTAEHVATS